uniref:SH3 domain-containing protein n=1 Tax=Caenorhabditis tropicalis TaxID=1561998 RepID=A0A1I7T922_9PELO
MDSSDEEYMERVSRFTSSYIRNKPHPECKSKVEKKEKIAIMPPEKPATPKRTLPASFGGDRKYDAAKRCQELGLPKKFGGAPLPPRKTPAEEDPEQFSRPPFNPAAAKQISQLPKRFGGVPKKPEPLSAQQTNIEEGSTHVLVDNPNNDYETRSPVICHSVGANLHINEAPKQQEARNMDKEAVFQAQEIQSPKETRTMDFEEPILAPKAMTSEFENPKEDWFPQEAARNISEVADQSFEAPEVQIPRSQTPKAMTSEFEEPEEDWFPQEAKRKASKVFEAPEVQIPKSQTPEAQTPEFEEPEEDWFPQEAKRKDSEVLEAPKVQIPREARSMDFEEPILAPRPLTSAFEDPEEEWIPDVRTREAQNQEFQAPAAQFPEFEDPEEEWIPNVSIAEAQNQEFQAPAAQYPEFEEPEEDWFPQEAKRRDSEATHSVFEAPNLQLPEIRIPEAQIPQFQVPVARIPDSFAPQVQIPEMQAPELQIQESATPEEVPTKLFDSFDSFDDGWDITPSRGFIRNLGIPEDLPAAHPEFVAPRFDPPMRRVEEGPNSSTDWDTQSIQHSRRIEEAPRQIQETPWNPNAASFSPIQRQYQQRPQDSDIIRLQYREYPGPRETQHIQQNNASPENNSWTEEEQIYQRSSTDQMDQTIEPLSVTRQEYPEMFPDLRREMRAQETRRPQILPPLTKGKLSTKRPPRPSQASWEEEEPAAAAVDLPMDTDADRLLKSFTSEALEAMNEEQLQNVTNLFYEAHPLWKFKPDYPFLAEGIVQRDCETGQLKVFSSRLGKLMLEDTRPVKSCDYVYFMAIRPGVNGGCYFDTQPICLISAKFPSVERIVLRGYAILAHPIGPREESLKENRWVCWNDSLGCMSIISGAARTPLKKQPVWDKQLDVISISANFENRRFVVTKVVGLTNSKDKKDHFPHEVFLVKDAIFKRQYDDDLQFHSKTINSSILIKKSLVGDAQIFDNREFEMVIVPTFPRSTSLEFRGLLIITMPTTFWSRDKEWIREKLVARTDAYRR